MKVRLAQHEDLPAWITLRKELWPSENRQELISEALAYFEGSTRPDAVQAIYVCEAPDGQIVGMLELSLRSYAEGCRASPVPYIEGWYVKEEFRHQGIGRALMAAAEDWARGRGYDEIASDALIDNLISHETHRALGFDVVERSVHFRKSL